VEAFLDALDLQDATLAGVSIGGAVSLILAARRNLRITGVVAINPYDYAEGRGLARSSFLGWMIMTTSGIPIVGETVMRLRNLVIMKAVFAGGVADPGSIPAELLHEMNLVGNRPGHYRAFISLLRNAASWEAATKNYSNIDLPVLFVWGDEDWATPEERDHDRDLVPGAEMVTVSHAGHFLPLDRPDELIAQLRRFHRRHTASRVGSSAET
jgi:pimeloyl-ACP methyl ester carboxylesterase